MLFSKLIDQLERKTADTLCLASENARLKNYVSQLEFALLELEKDLVLAESRKSLFDMIGGPSEQN